ncbi:MAG: hypothetical protein SGJ27_02145 [Candidatus Melainabacteria bacterium]|nr:hypothetical protein [Candidatus Melainabacteria bacterium]
MSDQAKTRDQVKETDQKGNDRLEKPPDAIQIRNATPEQRDAALDAFTNKFDSMSDLLAIGEKGQSFGIKHDDGKVETTEQKKRHKIAEDLPPTSIMAVALTPEVEARTKAQKQAKHGLISESATHMALEATGNPAMQPVAMVRKHADALPDSDPQKQKLTELSRELAAEYSPKMRERYAQERPTNTPEGWLTVVQKISQLPMDKQFQVLGAGLMPGIEQYQHDERERAWGGLIGTVQGTGEVAQGLAKIADFGAACILGDNERAGKMGDEFGAALGQSIVGGVRLFEAADQYLFNIGYTGDYAKPFRDVVAAGQKLDAQWNQVPPREQERVKAKLITELLESGAIGAGGAGAIQKASKFTEVLDAVAIEAKALHAAAKPGIKKAAKAINNAVDELVQPVGDTGIGAKMPIPKRPMKDETKMLMSKADDLDDGRPRRLDESGMKREPITDKFPPSKRFVAELQQVVEGLSDGERSFLANNDVTIKPIRRVADKFPEQNSLGACYDQSENTIYVAEEVPQLGKFVPNYDLEFGFRHEFGHVYNAKFDSLGAWISDDPGFITAYRKDIAKLPPQTLDELQLSTKFKSVVRARDEVFADSYAHSIGLTSNNSYSQKMKQAFPNCLRYLEEI